MKKKKIKKIIIISTLIIALIALIISLIFIIRWMIDNKSNKDICKEINEIVEIVESDDNENTIILEEPEKEFDPYYDYIKMNLINVNIGDLKKINQDTVGWIKVDGTNINYPFVQTKDNEKYLNTSFNSTKNSAGWIFMDYRNNNENFDKNTVIYGHGQKNGTMFGQLNNVLKSDWLKNKDNYVIKLSTEHENTLWQIFSVYHIPTTNDYIKVNFKSDEEFVEFGNMLLNRSLCNFNTTISKDSKILTLSTCYNSKEKMVVHAKLIKQEKR